MVFTNPVFSLSYDWVCVRECVRMSICTLVKHTHSWLFARRWVSERGRGLMEGVRELCLHSSTPEMYTKSTQCERCVHRVPSISCTCVCECVCVHRQRFWLSIFSMHSFSSLIATYDGAAKWRCILTSATFPRHRLSITLARLLAHSRPCVRAFHWNNGIQYTENPKSCFHLLRLPVIICKYIGGNLFSHRASKWLLLQKHFFKLAKWNSNICWKVFSWNNLWHLCDFEPLFSLLVCVLSSRAHLCSLTLSALWPCELCESMWLFVFSFLYLFSLVTWKLAGSCERVNVCISICQTWDILKCVKSNNGNQSSKRTKSKI